MRVLALWLPRLPIHLALRNRPSLNGRPLVLLQGHGDEAVATTMSCEAARMGVLPGMSGGNARGRCPGAVFLADNAGACMDELERIAAIIRNRATTRVAMGGRDHLFVAVEDRGGRDETAFARRVAGLVEAWAGHEVRVGVADTREAAVEAAHAARRAPAIVPSVGGATEGDVISPFGAERELTGAVRIPAGAAALRHARRSSGCSRGYRRSWRLAARASAKYGWRSKARSRAGPGTSHRPCRSTPRAKDLLSSVSRFQRMRLKASAPCASRWGASVRTCAW